MNDNNNSLPTCCQKPKKSKASGFWAGLLYGLLPHTFCILFVAFSVIGATAGALFMKNFLMIPYLFPLLVFISIIFATISAVFYLKRNGLFSLFGIKRSWKYLSVLYGTTVLVGAIFIYGIFPALANLNGPPNDFAADSATQTALVSLSVDIPCSGHAPLINEELRKISGVKNIRFAAPNQFTVEYDPGLTNETQILNMEIFKTYQANKI